MVKDVQGGRGNCGYWNSWSLIRGNGEEEKEEIDHFFIGKHVLSFISPQ